MRRASRPSTAASVAAAAALAAAASATTPYDYAAPGAFLDSLCDLTFTDAGGAAFEIDLRPVATVNGTASGGGNSFVFTPCGIVNLACSALPIPQPYGAAVQKNGDWSCYFALSSGPPLHQLTDPANAASGGITTFFGAAWLQASNPDKCGDWDPVKGREEGT